MADPVRSVSDSDRPRSGGLLANRPRPSGGAAGNRPSGGAATANRPSESPRSWSTPDRFESSADRDGAHGFGQRDTFEPSADLDDWAPLSPTAAMSVRGDLGAAVPNSQALSTYGSLGASDFVGADDIRLGQLHQVVDGQNSALVGRVEQALAEAGLDATVYGRAKEPGSLLNKLAARPGSTVGGLTDLSGLRVDLPSAGAGYSGVYDARTSLQAAFGDGYGTLDDYVANPKASGYGGRLHDSLAGRGLSHELQIGSSDLSGFIDRPLRNAAGQEISVHDALYKGGQYGVSAGDDVATGYRDLLGQIQANDRAGLTVAENPALQADIDDFFRRAEAMLPEDLPAPSSPGGSGSLANRGFGVLGIGAGGAQGYQGYQEIREGRYAEGTLDLGAGAGNVAAGVATVGGRLVLGTALGGVAAGAEGAKDLYVGYQEGDAQQTAVGTFKTVGGGLMMAGAATLNPVLVAAGAGAYAGAVIGDFVAEPLVDAVDWATSWF